MLWQWAKLSASFGDKSKSRSFCLRSLFVVSFIVRLLVWSTLILPSISHKLSYDSPDYDNDKHWLSHPRAPSLCAQTFNGLEGTPIKGFARDQVFIMTTPGLTYHQNVDSLLSSKSSSISHCHFHKFAKAHQSQKMKNYYEALWMKDKLFEKFMPGSDFKSLNHVPRSILCKDDMLTPKGVAQGIYLGEYLAKSYLNALSALSPFSFHTKGLAYSVGNEQLYQSVLAVLYGLLDEKQFIHAEVEKLSQHYTDDKLSRAQSLEDLDHFVKSSFKNEHHLFKDNSYPTGDRWPLESEFGREFSAKEILSSVSLKECDRRVKAGVHLSTDLIDSILGLSDEHNKYLSNSSIFLNYSKSLTLPFRKFLNTWVASYNQNDFKLVSVDDMFMLSLLNAIGVDGIEHIPPVSRLVIERFHLQSSSSSYLKKRPTSNLDIPLSFSSSSSSFTTPSSLIPSHLKVQTLQNHQEHYSSSGVDSRNVYFRVLYNGKVITDDIIHCRSDPLVSLGLCRMSGFVISLINNESIPFRDEL